MCGSAPHHQTRIVRRHRNHTPDTSSTYYRPSLTSFIIIPSSEESPGVPFHLFRLLDSTTTAVDGFPNVRDPAPRRLGLVDRRLVLRSASDRFLQYGPSVSVAVSALRSVRHIFGKIYMFFIFKIRITLHSPCNAQIYFIFLNMCFWTCFFNAKKKIILHKTILNIKLPDKYLTFE